MSSLPPQPATTPAEQLVGKTLKSGWTLVERLRRIPNGSGSNFGVGYFAERGAERAFVKAIDFVDALNDPDPLAKLQQLTSRATFEREAMELCDHKRLSRLIRLISHEYINLDPTGNPLHQVHCLVMEVGRGDLRHQLSTSGVFPPSVILGILSDVALGIGQLHRCGVAHQDVKPSNVISMKDVIENRENVFKVADLGRVVHKDKPGPFDHLPWPGDGHYAPPERWYGFAPSNWTDAREASDAYMLGSLVFFLFTETPLQPLLNQRIPHPMRPGVWIGAYADPLIHVLRSIQFNIITDTLAPQAPPSIRDSIVAAVKELIEPDPAKRGDKKARQQVGSPVGLERFHSRFRQLSLMAAIQERVKRS